MGGQAREIGLVVAGLAFAVGTVIVAAIRGKLGPLGGGAATGWGGDDPPPTDSGSTS
jgi:hypothetical protein